MTGFNSKRAVSLDTLDHIGYQGRETRPEELAPKPVAWMLASALDDLHMDNIVEVTKKQEEPDDVPLYLHPAAPVPAVLPNTEQIMYALDRQIAALDAHAFRLQAVGDYSAEFPAEDADRLREAKAMIAAAPLPEEHDMDDDGGCPVCGADGGTSCGMPNCGLLSAAPTVQSAARAIADEQSYDTGLWFVAQTATEAHLQAALRRLAAAVEGEAPPALTSLTDEQIWVLATQCTVGSDLHIDKFARAIEAAHGIGEKP
jgi:hypothetical protein